MSDMPYDAEIEEDAPADEPSPEEVELWIDTVDTIVERDDVTKEVANANLIGVLEDHEFRVDLWTSTIEAVAHHYGWPIDVANTNMIELLKNWQPEAS